MSNEEILLKPPQMTSIVDCGLWGEAGKKERRKKRKEGTRRR